MAFRLDTGVLELSVPLPAPPATLVPEDATSEPAAPVVDEAGTLYVGVAGSEGRVRVQAYTPAGVLVQSIPLPTAPGDSGRALTMSGTAAALPALT